jgi:hypothetical protein
MRPLRHRLGVTVPDSRTAALLSDLGAAAQEIGRLRWTLQQVVILARRRASAD